MSGGRIAVADALRSINHHARADDLRREQDLDRSVLNVFGNMEMLNPGGANGELLAEEMDRMGRQRGRGNDGLANGDHYVPLGPANGGRRGRGGGGDGRRRRGRGGGGGDDDDDGDDNNDEDYEEDRQPRRRGNRARRPPQRHVPVNEDLVAPPEPPPPVRRRLQPENIRQALFALGPHNPDRTTCWGCTHGRVNSPHVSMLGYIHMVNLYRSEKICTNEVVLATHLWMIFEDEIRGPYNKRARAKGLPEMAQWVPADILYHFQVDLDEASNEVHENIKELKQLKRKISAGGLFFEEERPDGGAGEEEVDSDKLKDYLSVLKELRGQRNSRPDRQFLYSNDWSLTGGDTMGLIAPRNFFDINMPVHVLGRSKRKQQRGPT